MRIPMLNACCCGCTLKTGTVIIGIIDIVIAAFNFIGGIVVASSIEAINQSDYPGLNLEEYRSLLDTLEATMIVAAVIGAILFIVASLLIAASLYESPKLVIPWLVYTCLHMLFNLIVYIINGATYASLGNGGQAALYFIMAILIL
ncbi:hypothetical protein L9F63_003236, partial [Diploptera punctata]